MSASAHPPARSWRLAGPSLRGFNLLRWFALLSLLCVLVSGMGTAFFLSRFLTEQMLDRDAEVSAEFLESIVRAERTWSWFSTHASEESNPALESFFNHVAQLPGVVRANVFATDGTVLWSSNASLIGRRFAGNHELEAALRGRIVVEAGQLPKEEHEALERATRFTESYLPVWDEQRQRVIGVVEIYRLPDALFRSIDAGVRLVWIAAGLSAALLYLALFWLAAKARALMVRQQQMLLEAEALGAVGAVASAVAHGIRNPLSSIRSSAELALLEDPAGVQACLMDIQREADRVERWVRDLLLQARGEAVAPSAVDVNQVLAESARTFMAKAAQQGVALRVEAGALRPVLADGGGLGQALDNLIANALEAMPEGGSLDLGTALEADGRHVTIRVTDTGTGLSPSPRDSLFFSTKPRGTGLGLVLTRRIIERHGGTLALQRRDGPGTEALIRLPVALEG
ncbi:sensor histidine kinase [Sediminicoccus rosea]|jgi:two-component system sensor histidine kinase HydH|uniref:histidine kinase n=1 Tax=Sediminicoccus rosea TaxID=1225128 RepID=A0ABZ0PCB2_9PROT|nr:ATP-binding protein [Sediminicoccus rosea]WPB83237.1 ATP-binding protein [Sediminicoccus rosea]